MTDRNDETESIGNGPRHLADARAGDEGGDENALAEIGPRAAEFGSRMLGFLESIKKIAAEEAVNTMRVRNDAQKAAVDAEIRAGEQRQKHERHLAWVQLAGIAAVVAAMVILALEEKLEPAVATVLGTVAGYLFGRRQDAETRTRN